MYTSEKNNTSPLDILCTLMPWIIPLLTLTLVHNLVWRVHPPSINCCLWWNWCEPFISLWFWNFSIKFNVNCFYILCATSTIGIWILRSTCSFVKRSRFNPTMFNFHINGPQISKCRIVGVMKFVWLVFYIPLRWCIVELSAPKHIMNLDKKSICKKSCYNPHHKNL